MKNNTGKTKTLIQQALASLPQDEALVDVRGDLKRAIAKIEHVESKRARRAAGQTAAQDWWSTIRQGVTNLGEGINNPVLRTDVSQQVTARALGNIDKMIQSEMEKIETLSQQQQRRRLPTKNTGDDDDVRTIHG